MAKHLKKACRLALNPSCSIACTESRSGWRALHDGLRARERDVWTNSLGYWEVDTADQQESELGLTQFLVELSIPASRNIELEGILAMGDVAKGRNPHSDTSAASRSRTEPRDPAAGNRIPAG